jgi:L-threonine kinase
VIPLDGLNVASSATVRVPATCGELLQGITEAGPVLVSLPVDLQGSVEVMLVHERVLSVTPSGRPKTMAALQLALDRVAWRGGAVVRLGGEVPPGHGMGSSTVDVAGVIAGVAAAVGVQLQTHDLLALMTAVEPSDSSPLPGLWLVDHVRGTRAMHLGDVPPHWTLVSVDSGHAVDTLALHARRGAGAPLPQALVDHAMSAARRGDSATLAAVATESAHRNQPRLAHPAFDVLHTVASRITAPGVCVAHSGSLCAVICHDDAQARAAAAALTAHGLVATTWRVGAPGLRVTRRSADDRRGGGSERGVLGDRRAAVPALLVRREDARRLPVRPR